MAEVDDEDEGGDDTLRVRRKTEKDLEVSDEDEEWEESDKDEGCTQLWATSASGS